MSEEEEINLNNPIAVSSRALIGASDPNFRRVRSDMIAHLKLFFSDSEGVQIEPESAGNLPNEIIRVQHIAADKASEIKNSCYQYAEWEPYIDAIKWNAGTLSIELITCDILAWKRKRQKRMAVCELLLACSFVAFLTIWMII